MHLGIIWLALSGASLNMHNIVDVYGIMFSKVCFTNYTHLLKCKSLHSLACYLRHAIDGLDSIFEEKRFQNSILYFFPGRKKKKEQLSVHYHGKFTRDNRQARPSLQNTSASSFHRGGFRGQT